MPADSPPKDLKVDVVSAKSPYRHLGDGSFVSWMVHAGKLGVHTRAASIRASQPSWLLEMPGHNFSALFEIVPGIVQRFQMAQEVQDRSHALKREQLGEHVLREMLCEQGARAEERNKVMMDARHKRRTRGLVPHYS